MESQKRSMLRSKLFWLICTVLIFAGVGSAAFAHYVDNIYNEISLDDNGYIVQIQTTDKTVEEFINKYEIVLGPGDQISPDLDEPIKEDTIIKIDRAFKVTVSADGVTENVYLTNGTIEEALAKAHVFLGKKDFANYSMDEKAAPGDYIRVTRVLEKVLIEKEGIPYQVVTKENNKLKKGLEKVVQEGEQGEKERKILIAYHNGVEVDRDIVEEKVAKEPVNRVIDKGTYVAPKPKPQVSRASVDRSKTSSKSTSSNKEEAKKQETAKGSGSWEKINISVTKYCACSKCCGKPEGHKYYGMTASGKKVKANHTIAAGSQYPFGTKFRINGIVYTVEDRGGAIYGNRIDIYVPNHSEAHSFGRVSMQGEVLK